jgi:hypothetical protein
VGTVMWALLACQEEPEPVPLSAEFYLEVLGLRGSVRSDGEVVQAEVNVLAGDGWVRLGGADELTLLLPDGEQSFTELADHQLVAQLPSTELEGALVLSREDEALEVPFSLPTPLTLSLEDPYRVRWEPAERGKISVVVEGMCLDSPLRRPLSFDQGWYEVQPADVPLAEEACELWVTVQRAEQAGRLLLQQVRTISLEMGPVMGVAP